MKLTSFFVAILLLSVCVPGAASAQTATIPANALLLAPTPSITQAIASTGFSPMMRGALLASPRPAPASPAPQGVQGVFPSLYWQTYVGFSYMRFYELPATVVNTSGFEVSMAYYFKPWIAAEGELSGGIGSQGPNTAKSVFSGGGVRLRWSAPRALEAWVHGVVGGAHFLPKTNFGGAGAFAYEIGAGVDLKAHHEHLAYRVGADLVGTTFFNTYQVSPKLSAGIVYKF